MVDRIPEWGRGEGISGSVAAAGHVQQFTRDERGPLGSQEGHGIGDVLDRAQTRHRLARQRIGAQRVIG
ncbi:hypothetical protein G6F57_021633 [Rhizopus arrhizus]|nr:hypothetical protein G6F40_016843 [Rhizopus arrhizus]KAG1434329.1 hypothetical protein G6F57_021633 [Rhizopus arrhizus]